jgi:hypothetical protein
MDGYDFHSVSLSISRLATYYGEGMSLILTTVQCNNMLKSGFRTGTYLHLHHTHAAFPVQTPPAVGVQSFGTNQ